MLDTSMVSYIVRGKSPAARARLAALATEAIACISAITEGELRYGLAKIPDAAKRSTSLEWFLATLRILPWYREEARSYGILRLEQESEGRTLENMDMLIAAHAIAVGAVLVTRDKVFSRVPGLASIENWATDL